MSTEPARRLPPVYSRILLTGWLLATLHGLALAGPVRAAATISLPTSVAQGGLVRGSVAPGTRVRLLPAGSTTAEGRTVRVSADGLLVIGVGRDEAGPLRLELTAPDGAVANVNIPVTTRKWKIEDIKGVPESTVNPPPAIAARIEREQAEVATARLRDDDRDDFDGVFAWPVRGRVSGVYGSQRIYNGTPKSPHSGLDVAAVQGTPVLAPAGGVISFARPDLYLTGGTVLIDHGHGLSSNFLHLSRIDVRVGDRVERGQRIGLVGATGRATGPHMHWGMSWFTVRVDPQLLLDPRAPSAP